MSSYSRAQTDWVLEALESYDFAKITHLCDVVVGRGYMLCRFLEKHPHLRGTVLEQAEVISDSTRLWAREKGLSNRCEYVAGDMFDAVPTAAAYIMKLILHDWSDDECVQILQNQYREARPGGRDGNEPRTSTRLCWRGLAGNILEPGFLPPVLWAYSKV